MSVMEETIFKTLKELSISSGVLVYYINLTISLALTISSANYIYMCRVTD